MAVTLFHKYTIVIKNKVTINNKKEDEIIPEIKEQEKKTIPREINARIRGKMYGRRTINR